MGKLDDYVAGIDPTAFDFDFTVFTAGLAAAHQEDVQSAMSIPAAKIDQLTTAKATVEQENIALKARNYDLMMLATNKPEEIVDPADTPPTIDSFFHK